MKVETITETGFRPIELKITIESQEEKELLKRLFLLDVSIPELVFGNDPEKENKLNKIMREIYQAL